MKRYLIYCRVSTAGQEDNTSLKSQEKACRALIKESGGQVAGVFSEVVSGSLYLARMELQKAIGAIEAHEADGLVMLDMERFARHAAYQEIAFERIMRAGGEVLFVHDKFEPTPDGRMLRTIKAAVTQYYREKMRILSMEANRELAEAGRMPQRNKPPYGYRIVQTEEALTRGDADLAGRYEPHRVESKWAKKIYEWCAGGMTLHEITVKLINSKAPTMYGGVWQAGTVSSILRSTVYKGEAVYGKFYTAVDEARLESGRSQYYRVARPRDEWIIIPCPRTVSDAVWEECQRQIDSRRCL